MTPDDTAREEQDALARVSQVLEAATTSLRTSVDERWVEVSDRILGRALAATRRSQPILAETPDGPVRVSEQVVVAYLRAAVDGAVPGCAVSQIGVEIADRETFTGATVQLVVRFGEPLLPIADRVREIAAGVLTGLLGTAAPPVSVQATHVHVSDVTRGDPQLTDPSTEA